MEDNGLNPSSEEKKDPMEKSDAQPKKPFVPGWYFQYHINRAKKETDEALSTRTRDCFPGADIYTNTAEFGFAYYKAEISSADAAVLVNKGTGALIGSALLTYLPSEVILDDVRRVADSKKASEHTHDESCLPDGMPPEIRKMVLEIMNAKDGVFARRTPTLADLLRNL